MKNTSIRIISVDFELLGEIDDYESLIFIRRFYKVGEFELHININKNNVDKLQEDNLILLGTNTKKVGVIRHREIKLDEKGEATETLIVKGYTLKGVLGRRIIISLSGQAYDNAIGTQEQIMKQFVNNNVVNPVDPARKIPQVAIAPNRNRGKEDKWRGRFEKLTDKLQEIGDYSELGWDIWLDIDNNKWVFDVIEGRNLTANQEVLPPVIFSVDFDNIKGQTYIDSALNYSNVGYAGGKGEVEERLIQQIGEASGFERIESFLDCSNAEDIVELKKEGPRKLEELKKIKTFESQVTDFGSFVYMQDWDLGDIVTAQNRKWNVTMDARIVEVKEIYEVNGFNLEVVFGNNVPTILDKIKKLEQQKLVEAKTGVSGLDGEPGKSVEFAWKGTELGIKQEGQEEYKYVNLQGSPGKDGLNGERGVQGLPGENGKSLEFIWNGSQLGIKQEGDTNYSYVNLKGEKGDEGNTGLQGIPGKNLEFVWNGTQLGVRVEGQSSYSYVELKGDKGEQGEIGPRGLQGPKGDVGLIGPQGIQGKTGATGLMGPKGTDGITPAIGSNGNWFLDSTDTGKPSRGIQGPKGDTGAAGAQGPKGATGPQGSAGTTDYNKLQNKPNLVGLGDRCVEVTGDWSTYCTKTGFYMGYNLKNAPTQNEWYYITVMVHNTTPGWCSQVAIGFNSNKHFCRNKINGKWTDWVRMASKDDIPVKLSQLQNDIGAGGGTNIVCSSTEPTSLKADEWWYKE